MKFALPKHRSISKTQIVLELDSVTHLMTAKYDLEAYSFGNERILYYRFAPFLGLAPLISIGKIYFDNNRTFIDISDDEIDIIDDFMQIMNKMFARTR